MKQNVIVVFDFETWDLDVNTLEAVQIACLAIDPVKLKVIEGSEFCSYMRPLDMTNFSQRAIDVNGITPDKVKDAPERATVWPRFCEHVRRFNMKGKSTYGAPYGGGKNIRRFDTPIANRLCVAHGEVGSSGKPNVFHERRCFDIEDDLLRWFSHCDELGDLSFDSVREYLGLSKEGSHDAMVDVRQTAQVLIRFLGLYKDLFRRIKFRGSFAGAN